jgi:hypothetical protein
MLGTLSAAPKVFAWDVCIQVPNLKQGIAEFYDESSGLWERMWGEHMHHGK